MTKLDVQSVAVIGAGPGGLAALYELSHTNADGTTTVGQAKAPNPQFKNIVAFEQKSKWGGIWAPEGYKTGLRFPPQDILDTDRYNMPDVIYPSKETPEGLEKTSRGSPLHIKKRKAETEIDWNKSGIFPELFTNVPSRYMRFSYMPHEEKFTDKNRVIYPFLTLNEFSHRLYSFVEREKLDEYIRVNSRVEKVFKTDRGKWIVVVRETSDDSGTVKWYQEEFDAIISAVGHYSIPHIPCIPGLNEYNKLHGETLMHAKSFRNREIFRNKKVIVIGSNLSSTNLLQYIVPLASGAYISKRSENKNFPWIDRAVEHGGIICKPSIEKFIPETKEVLFTDGSVEKDFDLVIFATGYHFHFPFLEQNFKVIRPSHTSRVKGLYYNTFSINDPTLAAIGVTTSPITFHTLEAAAAAIAGVWSNAKALPSKEDQIVWEKRRVEETGENVAFHYYKPKEIKEKFFDEIQEYFAFNRHNPFEEDSKYLHEIDEGLVTIEQLFYDLKDGKLLVEETSTLLQ